MYPTLQFFEEGGKAQGRALSHPNTRGELWGQIIIPGVTGELIYYGVGRLVTVTFGQWPN
jgi:hypothetical protein